MHPKYGLHHVIPLSAIHRTLRYGETRTDPLMLFTLIRQDKKLKTFKKFMYPSLPPRTAAGGHVPPMRWGIWLTASVFAAFSVVLIRRSHLGNA